MSDEAIHFDDETRRLMRRAGERARDTPGMLGHALRRYAELARLHDAEAAAAELAGRVMDADELARLCLCRCPAGPTLANDAAAVAAAYGLDAGALVRALRRVEVADAFAGGGSAGTLAARRDEEAGDA